MNTGIVTQELLHSGDPYRTPYLLLKWPLSGRNRLQIWSIRSQTPCLFILITELCARSWSRDGTVHPIIANNGVSFWSLPPFLTILLAINCAINYAQIGRRSVQWGTFLDFCPETEATYPLLSHNKVESRHKKKENVNAWRSSARTRTVST